MKYNIDNINPENNFLFFWGYQPAKDGTLSNSCLSQWWQGEFEVKDVLYKSAEHWMMAKKAELFNDSEILEKVIQADMPAEAKKLGREIKNYVDEIWVQNRFEIVKQGNLHKFSQHEDLKQFLLQTQNQILVEASPVDFIWGIGLTSNDENAKDPKKWKGLNLLGFALMEVRDELKAIYKIEN